MDNNQILTYCQIENPDIIYLAIGCAQGHHPPDSPMASPQEHPPCIAALGGNQVCILIDPQLETPIRAGAGTESPDAPIIRVGDTLTFLPVRRHFNWVSQEDKYFIEDLCRLVLNTRTRLIVQDYSGQYVHNFYPLATFGPRLLRKVLFDVTYRDSGCFIDFDKVKIMMREDGSFIQPLYDRLANTLPFITPEQRAFAVSQRHDSMWCYVKRLHRIQSGLEEFRDWCTADVVYLHMVHLCPVYGTPLRTDNAALEKLMVAYLFDLCVCVGDFMTEDEALALATGSGKEYQDTLTRLKAILLYKEKVRTE